MGFSFVLLMQNPLYTKKTYIKDMGFGLVLFYWNIDHCILNI